MLGGRCGWPELNHSGRSQCSNEGEKPKGYQGKGNLEKAWCRYERPIRPTTKFPRIARFSGICTPDSKRQASSSRGPPSWRGKRCCPGGDHRLALAPNTGRSLPLAFFVYYIRRLIDPINIVVRAFHTGQVPRTRSSSREPSIVVTVECVEHAMSSSLRWSACRS